jgi:hypothetical protein
VAFVVDKAVLGQVFSEYLSLPCQAFHRLIHTHHHLGLVPTQHSIHWVPGALFPWLKQQGHEADYLTPTCAEIKKMWSYTSTPPYTFMV